MFKHIQFALILAAVAALSTGPILAGQKDPKAGEHKGEVKQLDIEITFSHEFGQTVTDAKGTHYHFWGRVFHENKVYPKEYWGTFPLYFFGTPVHAHIKVTNKGPRAKAKLAFRAESYVLRTDGSNGAQLMEPEEFEMIIPKGKTREVEQVYVVEYSPAVESGLDRFILKVSHPNEGGGPGNEDPALIMVKEAVYCPPDLAK